MSKTKEVEIMEMKIERLSVNESENREQIIELYIKCGKIYQSLSKTDLAIDCFNGALQLDPNNKEAKAFLEYIYEILDYYYKETYNA